MRKRRFNSFEDVDEEKPTFSKRPEINLNLAPDKPVVASSITPYNVYIGDGLYIELKNFRKVWYLNFTRFGEHGDVKNRFNINIKQFQIFKKGIDAIANHLKKTPE